MSGVYQDLLELPQNYVLKSPQNSWLMKMSTLQILLSKHLKLGAATPMRLPIEHISSETVLRHIFIISKCLNPPWGGVVCVCVPADRGTAWG